MEAATESGIEAQFSELGILPPAVRQDSGPQYVGVKVLPESLGFKPMYPFHARRGFLRVADRRVEEGFQEYSTFAAAANKGAYDKVRTVRLFSGHTTGTDAAGVAIPLTPVIDGKCLFLSCSHTVTKKKNLQGSIDVDGRWEQVLSDERFTLEKLKPVFPEAVRKAGDVLHPPSSPDRNLENTTTKTGSADICLLRASAWDDANQPEFWFYPDPILPVEGDQVILFGHGGDVENNETWKRAWLATSKDYEDYVSDIPAGETPMTPNDWTLSPLDALNRYQDLRGCAAINPHTLTASPGTVHAANDEVVEHTCSVVPGISGGAGVDMVEPRSLRFMHIQSRAIIERTWSYGVSVRHPVMGYLYIYYVVPRLQTLDPDAIGAKGVESILGYLDHFDGQLDEWHLRRTADKFRDKFRI